MGPGFDGEKPEFVAARDQAGVGKRQLQGIMNINTDRVIYLYHHRRIDERQFLAAQRLERDWQLSLIDPVASMVLVGACGGQLLPADAKVAAMRRHGAAKAALGRAWAMVDLVVHKHYSVERASAMFRIHRKCGFGVLWASLHALADHYRMP
jgi:hypothetical protein